MVRGVVRGLLVVGVGGASSGGDDVDMVILPIMEIPLPVPAEMVMTESALSQRFIIQESISCDNVDHSIFTPFDPRHVTTFYSRLLYEKPCRILLINDYQHQ